MIYVDRSNSKAAGRFASELEGYKNDALNFFSMPEDKRGQSRFDFVDVDHLTELKLALIEEFHGKCAYTESRINPKNAASSGIALVTEQPILTAPATVITTGGWPTNGKTSFPSSPNARGPKATISQSKDPAPNPKTF